MEEVILKPKWSNFDVGNSKTISDFFDMEKIERGQEEISLDLLRDYYRKDGTIGSTLIEELALRGYSFYGKKDSSFLPANYEPKRIIRVKDNSNNCFQKINYNILGLTGIIKKFSIDSDSFYDYIPLEGFKCINKHISIDMIANEFSNAGFLIEEIQTTSLINIYDIISLSKLDKITDDIKNIGINNISDFCKNIDKIINIIPNLNKYDVKRMKIISQWYDEKYGILDLRGITIAEYFDFRNKNFEGYCKKKGYIKTIELINDHHIKRFKKIVNIYVDMFITYLKVYYYKNLETEVLNIKITDIENLGTENTIKSLIKNGITTIGELLKTNLNNIVGLGEGKIANINYVIFDLIGDSPSGLPPVCKRTNHIQKSLYDIRISDFFLGAAPQNFIDYCEKNNYIYVRDFADKDLNELLKQISGFGASRIKIIKNELQDEKYNTTSQKELLNIIFDEFIKKNKELYSIVYERIIKGKTLEEIGTMFKLTRERIRQLERKGMRGIISLANILCNSLLKNSELVYIDEKYLDSIFDDNNKAKIIYSVLRDRNEFYYSDYFDKIFVLSSFPECKQFISEMGKFLHGETEDSKDILSEPDFKKGINEIASKYGFDKYILDDDYAKMIEKSNYRFSGNILIRKGVYIHDIYSKILRDYFPNGITFNEENCDKMKEIYAKLTKEKSDLSVRNLSAKLQRDPKVILRGSNTYIHIDNVNVDENILEVIRKYIIHLFKQEGLPSVYSDRIYSVFKEELNRYGIDNYAYIYGVLRYYYPKEFDYNNFWITKNGKKEITRDLALIDYLKKDKNYNIGIPKEQIISLFGLSGPFLANLTVNSNEIQECHNKENLIYYKNYRISDKTLEKIKTFVEDNIDSQYGYISLRFLLSKYKIYLEEDKIDDDITLGNALKNYLNEYYIKDQYICKEKTDDELNEYFFFELYLKEKRIITRKGFEAFAEEKGISANRVYDVLKSRLEGLYQLNITDFARNLTVSTDDLSKIYEIIDKNIEGREYLPLSDLKKNGDLYRMPKIEYPWNEYILRSILIKRPNLTYRIIDIPGLVLFSEKGIVIKSELKISNYIELLMYVYRKNNYYLLENANQVFKELQLSGLVSDTLPNEFKKRIVDEYGRLMRC